MKRLICEKCGWHMDSDDVAIKPFCPDCKERLWELKGKKEEIGQRTMEILAEVKK